MGMEPDIREFLVRVVNTISMALIWMIANTVIGIRYNYAFFEKSPSAGNYLFYAGFVTSLVLLIYYFKKKWKL